MSDIMNFEVVSKEGPIVSGVNPTVIKVVGCGGGGSNAVNRMIEADIKNVDFIALNTDLQALGKSVATNRLAIGQKITQGLGAGGDPSIGEKAAEEDKDAIANILKGANMVFVTAGMGGGTGTGSAPVVAKIAKEIGALTVGVVTTPFAWEGPQRMRLAHEGIKALKEAVDSVIIIPNEKIVDVYGKDMKYAEQFRAADDLLRQGIEGMSNIITLNGTPNIDFADVRAAMQGQGTAIFGIGRASGESRATKAASMAIHNPLLEDTSIDGARHFLVNVCASSNFSINELQEISKVVSAGADPNYDLKPGVVTDENMQDEISVTVIATGFGNTQPKPATSPIKATDTPSSTNAINAVKKPSSEEATENKKLSSLLSGEKFKVKTSLKGEGTEEKEATVAKNEAKDTVPPSSTSKSFDEHFSPNLNTMDINDPNTPAVLRHKTPLTRTINFNR